VRSWQFPLPRRRFIQELNGHLDGKLIYVYIYLIYTYISYIYLYLYIRICMICIYIYIYTCLMPPHRTPDIFFVCIYIMYIYKYISLDGKERVNDIYIHMYTYGKLIYSHPKKDRTEKHREPPLNLLKIHFSIFFWGYYYYRYSLNT